MNKPNTLDKIIISPEIWPEKEQGVQPGDLTKFAPYGNGVYGYQKIFFNPIINDPPQEASGGAVYFDNRVEKQDFEGFLRMMNVLAESKDYAAFINESSEPLVTRHFRQMRLVPKFALRHMFKVIDDKEYEKFRAQELTVGEALWNFMESERQRFGTFFGDRRIEGKFGGDGYFVREKLSFGFMLENSYYNVCRIWSRAWLVTK